MKTNLAKYAHRVCALILLASFALVAVRAQAQELGAPSLEADAEIEVLTRGPIHEAFAEVVTYDPKPGEPIAKAPPDPIDEVPPEARPEGPDVAWIPGYWAYDDDLEDFIWISGVWRKFPPDMRWVQGYWAKLTDDDGAAAWQWVSGFWTRAEDRELEYYDAPPASLERGPSSPAPGDDYFWTPGIWNYYSTGYRWHPGYWNAFRPGWVWVPARYCWTPRGYLHLGGYWDFPLAFRGHLYAPVFYRRPLFLGPRYFYTPRVVVGGPAISLHLFYRTSRARLYFGDYYGPLYARRGFHPCLDFHVAHRGFDPIFAYNQVSFARSGINYEQRVRGWHSYYAANADLRPPRTFTAQQDFAVRHARNEHARQSMFATPLADLAARPDARQTLVRLTNDQRQAAARDAAERAQVARVRQQVEVFSAPTISTRGAPDRDRPAAERATAARARLELPAAQRLTTRTEPPPRLDAPRTLREPAGALPAREDRTRDARTDDPRRLGTARPGAPAAESRPTADPTPRREPTRAGVSSPAGAAPRIDAPRVDTPRVGAPRVDTPRVDALAPRSEPPRAGVPRVAPQPSTSQPGVASPRVTPPRIEAPAPRVDTPRTVAPRALPQPRVEPPRTIAPRVEAPSPRIEPPRTVAPRALPQPSATPPRVTAPRIEAPTPRVDTPRAAPARVEPPRAAPQPRIAPQPRAEPQPRATPQPRIAPQPRATPQPRAAPQPRATPSRPTPSRPRAEVARPEPPRIAATAPSSRTAPASPSFATSLREAAPRLPREPAPTRDRAETAAPVRLPTLAPTRSNESPAARLAASRAAESRPTRQPERPAAREPAPRPARERGR